MLLRQPRNGSKVIQKGAIALVVAIAVAASALAAADASDLQLLLIAALLSNS